MRIDYEYYRKYTTASWHPNRRLTLAQAAERTTASLIRAFTILAAELPGWYNDEQPNGTAV